MGIGQRVDARHAVVAGAGRRLCLHGVHRLRAGPTWTAGTEGGAVAVVVVVVVVVVVDARVEVVDVDVELATAGSDPLVGLELVS